MFAIIKLILAWFVLLYAGTSQNLYFVVKVILVWLMLEYIGINLVGMVVRPFLSWSSLLVNVSEDLIKLFELRRKRVIAIVISLIFLILTVAYLIAIYHFWNVGLVVSAGLVMVSRLPDLLWEIRTGTKISLAKYPKGVVSIIYTVIGLLSLPLTWYSLFKWTP